MRRKKPEEGKKEQGWRTDRIWGFDPTRQFANQTIQDKLDSENDGQRRYQTR